MIPRKVVLEKFSSLITLVCCLLLITHCCRSVSGIGDETVTGSYRKNITGDTISKFIQDLDTDLSNHGSNM